MNGTASTEAETFKVALAATIRDARQITGDRAEVVSAQVDLICSLIGQATETELRAVARDWYGHAETATRNQYAEIVATAAIDEI